MTAERLPLPSVIIYAGEWPGLETGLGVGVGLSRACHYSGEEGANDGACTAEGLRVRETQRERELTERKAERIGEAERGAERLCPKFPWVSPEFHSSDAQGLRK